MQMGLKVNVSKTKALVSGGTCNEIVTSGKYPCGVCGKGVGSNSIMCKECEKWVHRRCSGKMHFNCFFGHYCPSLLPFRSKPLIDVCLHAMVCCYYYSFILTV